MNEADPTIVHFPKTFVWGAGTSAFQIEGAVHDDGRGESIWDRFTHTPGKIQDGSNADVACDHYHRYEQDLTLLQALGIQSYRFSIAWPRIQPEGRGAANQRGLDFYRRLVDGLQRRGIVPCATIYHWDLPQALEDQGGWLARDTALRFVEYAELLFRGLGDQVPLWITHNEPKVVAHVGYGLPAHAPGRNSFSARYVALHHLLLSHGLAVAAFRAAGLGGQIGIALNLSTVYPDTDAAADQAAAWLVDGYENRMFLDPLFRGSYPPDMLSALEARGVTLDVVCPEDMPTIAAPIDFLGVNYYSSNFQRAAPQSPFYQRVERDYPRTTMDWAIVPEGLYDLLLRITRDYGPRPIYITENGASFDDQVDADGVVRDTPRIKYLQAHFLAAHRALVAGVNLRGFYVWSLLDNFEWNFGFSKRFGLIYVDYTTQQRMPKQSAAWFRDVIQRNGLVLDH